MKQQDYETIIKCIQYGAPVLAPELIQSLNLTVENENKYLILKREEQEEARKAEYEKDSVASPKINAAKKSKE